jgi:two-component system sensor histidine kinase EvgS
LNSNRIKTFFLVSIIAVLAAGPLSGHEKYNTSNKPVLSGCEYDYPPFCIVDNKAQADGFSVELLRAALEAMGRKVIFNVGPWPEVKKSLETGRVQVLPLVGRTPEREEIFDFTFPYLSLHGTIVVREGNDEIYNLSDLKGKEVAVLQGDNAEEFLRRSKLDVKIITTKSFTDALMKVSKGKHDAVVIQKLLALRLIKQEKIGNLRCVGQPLEEFTQNFCFAVKEGDKALLATLNEGLSLVIADGTFRHLHKKWFVELDNLPKSRIVVGGDSNYPPYEYLDENGQPAGYNVELTRAIAAQAGIDVHFKLGKWADIRNGLEQGEIDMIHGMFYSLERDKYFDFSQRHTYVHYVAVTRKDSVPPVNSVELEGKSIVVMDGDIMHEFALKQGLENQLTLVNTQGEALKQLAEGKYDCALVAQLPAFYYIRKDNLNNLQVAEVSLQAPEYCFAVLHGNKKLLSEFSEGLAVLEETGRYRDVYSKWLGIYRQDEITFRDAFYYVVLVAGPAVFLLALAVLWSRTLKHQVDIKTKELAESEKRYKAVVEDQTECISRFKPDGEMTWVNHNTAKLVNMLPEEVVGTNLFDQIDETHAEIIKESIAGMTIERPTAESEQWIMLSGGERICILWANHGIFDDEGNLVEIQGVGREITDYKHLENQMLQSEKMKAIGQLAGGVAHDFNNQLTGILGYANMLVEKLDDPRLRRYAENIIKSSKRSAALTGDLLAFSRKGKNLSERVDMHKIISDVVSILEHSIDKRIKITQLLKARPAAVTGDPNQLQNAILNIAINARDVMPEGGCIAFETNVTTLDEDFCNKQSFEIESGDYVMVSISDTGSGISEDIKTHIFEPFFTTKDVGEGAGMGLAGVLGTVESHNGMIDVESECGKGAKFRIYLPVSDIAEKIKKDTPVEKPAYGEGHIMLIDDEEIIRELGSDMFKELGYNVTSFEESSAAVAFYEKCWQEIDLVIIDMIMPDLGGRDIFAALKKINPEIRALLSSGYTLDGEAQEILKDGVKGFIGKPFTLGKLSKEVSSALKDVKS